MERSPEAAFIRYRRSGDARALAFVFDHTAPEVQRVALHLTGRQADAEDLLQATYLTAMERAAQFPEGGRLVPWLLAILTNRLRMQRRRERVAARVTPARQAEPTDPVSAAQGRELQELLATRLGALPELYRLPLVLQLQHGLTAAEVAQALERPRGTVRSQLSRGMELLRAALPAGLGAGVVVLATSRTGLAAVRAAVLGASAKTAGSLGTLGGLVAMKKLLLAAAGLLLMASVAWMAWGATRPIEDPLATPAGPRSMPALARERAQPASVAASGPATQGARVEAALPSSDALVVQVRWSDGLPAAGVAVWLHPDGEEFGGLAQRWLMSGDDGVARSPRLRPGRWVVGALQGGKVAVDVAAGATARADLTIPAGLDVRGMVVDPEDRPVAGARVALGPEGSLLRNATETGTDGTFALRSVDRSLLLSAFAHGYAPVPAWRVRGLEARMPVVIRLEKRSGALRGRVLTVHGEPIAGATVMCGRREEGEGDPMPMDTVPDEDRRPRGTPSFDVTRTCQTDARGEFEIEGVPNVEPLPLWAGATGFAARRVVVRRSGLDLPPVEVRLDREAILTGTVRAADGSPCPKVAIELRDANSVQDGVMLAGPRWAPEQVRTDEAGRFTFVALPAGRAAVSVTKITGNSLTTAVAYVAWREFELQPGQAVHWDAVLESNLAVVGVLNDHRAIPLAGWTVTLKEPEGAPGVVSALTGADGAFRMAGCVDAEYTLRCHEPRKGGANLVLTLPGVRPGPDVVRLTVPESQRASCTLTGLVHDANARPVAGAEVYAVGPRGQSGIVRTQEDGRFRIEAVPAGTWQIEFRHQAHGQVCLGRRNLVPAQTLDLGTLLLPAPAQVTLHLRDELQRPVKSAHLYLSPDTGSQTHWIHIVDGVSAPFFVTPGRYTASTSETGSHRCLDISFLDARAGEPLTVDLHLVPGVCQVFVVDPPGGECIDGAASFLDARGTIVQRTGIHLWHSRPMDMPFVLLPGRYTARFALLDGRTVELPFELAAQAAPQPLPVHWPK